MPFPVLPIRIAAALVATTALAAATSPARADVADPRFCSADARIVTSPAGAGTFRVTLRDASNTPLVGATAILDFNASVGVALCPTADADRDGRLTAITGANGVAEFSVPAGGASATPVKIGTILFDVATAVFTSLDLDGDLDVDADDRAALVALFGTSGPTGDFDGNGAVDAADQSLLDAGVGSLCGEAVPPPPPPPPPTEPQRSWGGVKALYR